MDPDAITALPPLRDQYSAPANKDGVDSHFRLDEKEKLDLDPAPTSPESPPPFASHNFPHRYFPVTDSAPHSLTAFAPLELDQQGPAPPSFEGEEYQRGSAVVAETKAALPRDTKVGQSSRDLDDGEPPPPYTEGDSPLAGFTYVMAAAGGAASILTQVQQSGPAPLNTALGGGGGEFAHRAFGG